MNTDIECWARSVPRKGRSSRPSWPMFTCITSLTFGCSNGASATPGEYSWWYGMPMTSSWGFQNPDDASRFRREIEVRLQEFGLAVHPDKTRLIRFGRFAHEQNRKRGLGKPETFNFLGFTHICGVSRQGRFLIHRKTRRDRLQAKLKALSQELKKRLHQPVRATGHWLRSVVQGHLNYYGVPLNGAALSLFCTEVRFRWYRALCRRSQRKRLNWGRFGKIADHWIPKAKIVHPYPHQRFDAKYSR